MDHILNVIANGDDIELEVRCPLCDRRTVLFDEDCADCSHCGGEIERTNIAAWTEYDETKPAVTFRR